MNHISLYLVAVVALANAANLYSMDVPQEKPAFSHYINLLASDRRYQNPAFIQFQKAKIQANVQLLMREIPTLSEATDQIYSRKQALAIIEKSYTLFAGNNKKKPVPGYLELVENLEKNLALNNLHSLAGRLYELEHAIKLSNDGYTIIEFGPQIQIPENERLRLQAENGAHLLMDIDIYAQDPKKKPILIEVKSYKYCSDQAEEELRALIIGMHLLQKKFGITCRLHTKYAFKKDMLEFCREYNVSHNCDLTTQKMQKPNTQRPQRAPNPCLINEEEFVIIKRPNCIVCYPQAKNNRIDFIKALEHAHIAYIQSLIPKININNNLLQTIQTSLPLAQTKLSGVHGFLSPILSTLVSQAENEGCELLRSTAFEIVCALDVPKDKRVVALGAEMFFNPDNNPVKGPMYVEEDGCYLRERKELTGYDLDVLLQDADDQEGYSFIEATTGRSNEKDFNKFRTMGTFLRANVYVFHNFFDNQTFVRTAYLKKPVVIQLESGLKLAELPWHIACRTVACVQALSQKETIYRMPTLILDKSFMQKYAAFCKKFKENNHDQGLYGLSSTYSYWIIPSDSDINSALTSILKTIDDVSKKADQNSYKGRIKTEISRLLTREKENKEIGACACAVLLLQGLNCTMPAELRDRFIPADNQCAIDLDAALGTALDEAAPEEQWKDDNIKSWKRLISEAQIQAEEQDAAQTPSQIIEPNSPAIVRKSNNTTPENIKNDNNKAQ